MHIKSLSFILFSAFAVVVSLFLHKDSFAQDVDILHYGLDFKIDISAKHHKASTEIKFVLLQDNESVRFYLKNNNVDSVKMDGVLAEFSYDSLNLDIDLGESNVGDTIVATIFYQGGQVVEQNSMAWGGIHYDNSLIYTLGVAFLDYPHSYARSWFATNDAFNDKATFDFKVSVPENFVVCSGVLDSITTDSLTNYYYSLKQEVAPYLVSMAIADFEKFSLNYTSPSGDSIPLEVYYNEGFAEIIEQMFALVPQALDTLIQCFGDYPFNRAGYCVTPKGSMEHVDNIALSSGALNNQIDGMSNIVHELAHAWFGNLVTCSSQEEMWLNEGLTSFTVFVSLESIYGKEKSKNHIRNLHEKVLKNVVLDEGYLPLSPVDSTLTYSSTVYDKGSFVALSLKTFMRDSFFGAIRHYLGEYAFKNATSEDLMHSLEDYSGQNLSDFFEKMVFSSSTPHYEIAKKDIDNEEIRLTFLQRAYPDNTKTLEYSRIPVAFVSKDLEIVEDYAEFYGDTATLTFSSPFPNGELANVFIDLDEQFADLTTDCYRIIDTVGRFEFANTYFKAQIDQIDEPFLLRATLHWLGDTLFELPVGVSRVSNQHFWTIEGAKMPEQNIYGSFYYNTNPKIFDSTLAWASSSKDSIILLYRPNKASQWTRVPSSSATSSTGYIKTTMLWEGDYIMAIADKSLVDLKEDSNNSVIYPNPNNGVCTIKCENFGDYTAKLLAIDGRLLKTMPLKSQNTVLDYKNYSGNSFILVLENKKLGTYSSQILIKK